MKLRKLLSLSIAAILLCFTGCVNKNTLSKHEPITILAPYLECDRLVDLVHKKYPEINLKVLSYSGANTTTYLQNMLAADDLPDICTQTIYDPNIDDVSDRMIDLAGYDFTDNYVESRLQDISDDGAIYMLPSAYSCIGITYNKTLLENMDGNFQNLFMILKSWRKRRKKQGYSCV
jgi:carbohydrate ABC transporter substrate-binding protein, CUT1 family (TC 3.A.1.1.-)